AFLFFRPDTTRTIPSTQRTAEHEAGSMAVFAFTYTDRIAEERWRSRARCRDSSAALVNLFFSEQLDDILRAKAFCRECVVRQHCLESALAREEPCGVWGGELFSNGKMLAHARRRGRPPKVRPPEPVLEELLPAYRVAESA